jgi:gamma-glutamylaminecyclotransferase
MKIFVYGTLLRGFGNWRWALKDRAQFVKEDSIRGFTMVRLGGFPGIITIGNGVVMGEVFEFDDDKVLADLDRLEGHPRFYKRTPIKTESGEQVEVYVLNRAWNYGDHVNVVQSGSWREATGKAVPKVR